VSIKAGQLISIGNQVLVDRAQTAGPGTLNIPIERIYELGNYQSVGTIRDIPDLTFSLESFDASAQVEALLLDLDFATLVVGEELDLSKMLPMDVASQFKAGRNAVAPFEVEASVAIPYLTAESVSYKFGLTGNASQTVSLRGDSLFYSTGSAYVQETPGTNTDNQAVTLTHHAYAYTGDTVAGTRYALSVSLSKSGKRLLPGADYTEVATGGDPAKSVVVTVLAKVPVTDKIRITYQSDTKASYPQVSHALATSTRPAALKGRNIEILVGGVDITDRWSSVQNVTADWKVTLEKDEELGNAQMIGQDWDVPTVNGTIELKPRDTAELVARIQQIGGVTAPEVTGALSSVLLPLQIVLHSPDVDPVTHRAPVLKTIYVPDARFTLPGYSGKVQTKLTVTFPWESETGQMFVYNGVRANVWLAGVSIGSGSVTAALTKA
jgi:hypothetical protein